MYSFTFWHYYLYWMANTTLQCKFSAGFNSVSCMVNCFMMEDIQRYSQEVRWSTEHVIYCIVYAIQLLMLHI